MKRDTALLRREIEVEMCLHSQMVFVAKQNASQLKVRRSGLNLNPDQASQGKIVKCDRFRLEIGSRDFMNLYVYALVAALNAPVLFILDAVLHFHAPVSVCKW